MQLFPPILTDLSAKVPIVIKFGFKWQNKIPFLQDIFVKNFLIFFFENKSTALQEYQNKWMSDFYKATSDFVPFCLTPQTNRTSLMDVPI